MAVRGGVCDRVCKTNEGGKVDTKGPWRNVFAATAAGSNAHVVACAIEGEFEPNRRRASRHGPCARR